MKKIVLLLIGIFLFLTPSTTNAAGKLQEPNLNWQDGKTLVKLKNNATFLVNENETFLNGKDTIQLNEFAGNSISSKEIIGSIFPINTSIDKWQLVIEYNQAKVITSKAVKDTNINAYRKYYKGNEELNISNLEWAKKPYFNNTNNTLIQTISMRHNGSELYNTQIYKIVDNGYFTFTYIYPKGQHAKIELLIPDHLNRLNYEVVATIEKSLPEISLNELSLNGLNSGFSLFKILKENYLITIGLVFFLLLILFKRTK